MAIAGEMWTSTTTDSRVAANRAAAGLKDTAISKDEPVVVRAGVVVDRPDATAHKSMPAAASRHLAQINYDARDRGQPCDFSGGGASGSGVMHAAVNWRSLISLPTWTRHQASLTNRRRNSPSILILLSKYLL